jgi:ABC-type multidrug transport system fused ATPase/permease subunit
MQPLTTVTKSFLLDTAEGVAGKETSEMWITSKRAWLRYMRQAGGISMAISIFVFFWLVHGLRLASDIWVKVWQGAPGSSFKAYSLGATNDVVVYAGIVTCFAIGVLIRGIWLAVSSARKARFLHDSMLQSLIRAPMSFYDKTPLGRILQSSSKHQADADDRLPDSLMQWMQYLPLAVGSVAIMTWQSSGPLSMFFVIIVLLLLGYVLVWFARKSGAIRFYKDQQTVAKTTLFSHITASLEGLFSIRAFQCQKRFRTILLDSLDNVTAFDYSTQCIRFLIALYIDVLCSMAIFFNAFYFVIWPTDAATIGLSLSNALQLLVFVSWALRMWEEAQSSMQSIGNLQYLSEKIPSEAAAVISTSRPDDDWPQEGRISFQDVVLRYSTFGVAVLKRISFTIQPMEKIGIVGRTVCFILKKNAIFYLLFSGFWKVDIIGCIVADCGIGLWADYYRRD